MKLQTAKDKATRVVERLASGEGVDPQIKPTRLVLFGSILKGKDKPNDVDLFLEYERTELYRPDETVTMFTYRKPDAIHRTLRDLRKGMKMVRIVPVLDGDYELLELKFDIKKEKHEVLWEGREE